MLKIEIVAQRQDKVLNIVSQDIEGVSYSLANKLLRKKDIRINDKKVGENLSVNFGDKISIFVEDNFKENNEEKKYFDIVFEDDNIIIANKFKGIEVVSKDTAITVEKVFNQTRKKVYPLNRLDRNTEGLIILAKNKTFFEKLKSAMKNGEIGKFYLAEVVGIPKWESLNAIAFLQKDDEKSEVKIFDSPRKDSVKIQTKISVLSRSSGGTSVLAVQIKNGKTHQIRAHLAHLGFPIIGDGKYGKNQENKKFKSKTQKLTAYKLTFDFSDPDLKYLNEEEFQINPSWIKGE